MSDRFPIPDELVRKRTHWNEPAGAEWLARLPSILDECEQRWPFTLLPPFAGLSYNYVAPVRQKDGTPAVLKVCPPDREFVTEVEALRVYAGRGAVQILDVEADLGAMLLEHVRPGTLLLTLEDDVQATSITAGVMRQIWHPPPEEHHFPTLADWSKGMERLRAQFGGGTGPFPERIVVMAERLWADLLASMELSVVLHGDLHHYNILAAERQPWLAIDPKGVLGEPAYEIGALLRNPVPQIYRWPDLGRTLTRRIDQLSDELGLSPERIRSWGIAHAVLSAQWSFEDHGKVENTSIGIAELLAG